MRTCLLIGFEYAFASNHNRRFKPSQDHNIHSMENDLFLPGISVDLYQLYLFVQRMNPDKIFILTDIIRDHKTTVLMQAITDAIVDADVLTLIERCKENGQYLHYEGKDKLSTQLKECCKY